MGGGTKLFWRPNLLNNPSTLDPASSNTEHSSEMHVLNRAELLRLGTAGLHVCVCVACSSRQA